MLSHIYHAFIILLLLIMIFISFIVPTYRYELMLEDKQINDDSVIVINMICFFVIIACLSSVLSLIKKKNNIMYVYIIMLSLSLYRFIQVLLFVNGVGF